MKYVKNPFKLDIHVHVFHVSFCYKCLFLLLHSLALKLEQNIEGKSLKRCKIISFLSNIVRCLLTCREGARIVHFLCHDLIIRIAAPNDN